MGVNGGSSNGSNVNAYQQVAGAGTVSNGGGGGYEMMDRASIDEVKKQLDEQLSKVSQLSLAEQVHVSQMRAQKQQQLENRHSTNNLTLCQMHAAAKERARSNKDIHDEKETFY